MANCKPLFIGCCNYCDAVILPLVGNVTGIFTVMYQFKDSVQYVETAVAKGENIIIDNIFNESNLNIITITDARGNAYQIEKDGEIYTSFSFRTSYVKDWTKKIHLNNFCEETKSLCGAVDNEFIKSLIAC